ncbi:MAG: outer membrane beta-barrel family protein, partial [Bacteroidota bacterium]
TEEIVRYRTQSDESSADYLLQGDYEMPFGEFGKLEIGLRGESRIISADYFARKNEANGFVPIPGFNANSFDYYERIGAGYFQYGYEKEALGIQLGLRAEYTDIATENSSQEETNLAKNYLQFFPSASFQYKLSERSSTQLSYSRRIRRPQFWQLNPFGGIRLPSFINFGNPDIDPSYTERVELNFLTRNDKFTFNPAIYVSFVDDMFINVIEQIPTNIFGLEDGTIEARPANLAGETIYGLELDLGYRPTDKLNFNGYFLYYGFSQRGDIGERNFDYDFATWRANVRAQLGLPHDLSIQTRIGYNAYWENAQSENLATFNGSAAISKEWKDKYTVTLNAYAPRYFREVTFRPSFRQQDYFQWTGWRFGVNFQYRFEQGASSRERRQRGSIR